MGKMGPLNHHWGGCELVPPFFFFFFFFFLGGAFAWHAGVPWCPTEPPPQTEPPPPLGQWVPPFFFFFFFFFWGGPYPQHAEVPGPHTEPMPQQQPKPQLCQWLILNSLHPHGTPGTTFYKGIQAVSVLIQIQKALHQEMPSPTNLRPTRQNQTATSNGPKRKQSHFYLPKRNEASQLKLKQA